MIIVVRELQRGGVCSWNFAHRRLQAAWLLSSASTKSISDPKLLRQREAGERNVCSCTTAELNVRSATICPMAAACALVVHITPSDPASRSMSRTDGMQKLQVDVKTLKAVVLQNGEILI